MGTVEKIKRYFYYRQLNRQLERNRTVHSSINLERAQSIGILFDAHSETTQKAILSYAKKMEKQAKKISLLGYIPTKEGTSADFPSFNLKNISFTYLPKGELVEQFVNTPFDLLINLYFQDNLSLEYISSVSKARFRVGRHCEQLHCSDLMINMAKKEANIAFFLQQMEVLLQKMNPTTYESTSL